MNKRLTSDELLERLKTIVQLPEDIISLDISLRTGLFAVISLQRYATIDDGIVGTRFDSYLNRTIDETLAVYNVNDLDDILNENVQLRDILSRILAARSKGENDWEALGEAVKLTEGK